MEINYKTDLKPTAEQIVELYKSSGIIRPVNDKKRIREMYENSNLVITAWNGDLLVGVGRSLTDFSYCCYLSDLAVRKEYQSKGIGKKIIELTKEAVGERSMLLLLSAPGAMEYYPKVGFEQVNNGFIIKRVKYL
jgi:predicted N-acetyltransferase YhbS